MNRYELFGRLIIGAATKLLVVATIVVLGLALSLIMRPGYAFAIALAMPFVFLKPLDRLLSIHEVENW